MQPTDVTDATLEHAVLIFYIWSYKLASLLVGLLFARLGYSLFLKGITGEFKFTADIKGVKADLASASPGLFLILMGTIVVGVTLYRGFEVTFPRRAQLSSQPSPSVPLTNGLPRTTLPSEPPGLAPPAHQEDKKDATR